MGQFAANENTAGYTPNINSEVLAQTHLLLLVMIGTPILADRLNERFAR